MNAGIGRAEEAQGKGTLCHGKLCHCSPALTRPTSPAIGVVAVDTTIGRDEG